MTRGAEAYWAISAAMPSAAESAIVGKAAIPTIMFNAFADTRAYALRRRQSFSDFSRYLPAEPPVEARRVIADALLFSELVR